MQSNDFVLAVTQFVMLLFSLSVHETAHAWTASRLGDQTARMLGRISLNPKDHIDPIGTLLIPAIAIFGPLIGWGFLGPYIFGWAKPVPIMSRNFRNFRRDDMLVSLAGPASNLMLAVLAFFGLAAVLFTETHLPQGADPSTTQQAFEMIFEVGLQLNLVLCIFNLFPVPPLDGSHVLRQYLPYNAVQVYDRITGFASYLLIIVAAWFVLPVAMTPVLRLAYSLLARI